MTVDAKWRAIITDTLRRHERDSPSGPRPTDKTLVAMIKTRGPKGFRVPPDEVLKKYVDEVLAMESARSDANAVLSTEEVKKRRRTEGLSNSEATSGSFRCSKRPEGRHLDDICAMPTVRERLRKALGAFCFFPEWSVSRFLLLRGPRHSGRSYCLECLAGTLPPQDKDGSPLHLIHANSNNFLGSKSTSAAIDSLFNLIENSLPCVLLLDDLDHIFPSHGSSSLSSGSQSSNEKRADEKLALVMQFISRALRVRDSRLLCIASCEHGIDPRLYGGDLFDDDEITIQHQLTYKEQLEVLDMICRQRHYTMCQKIDWSPFASRLQSFLAGDLAQLLKKLEITQRELILDEASLFRSPSSFEAMLRVEGGAPPNLLDVSEGNSATSPVTVEEEEADVSTAASVSPGSQASLSSSIRPTAIFTALQALQPKKVKVGFYQTPSETFAMVGGLEATVAFIKRKLVDRIALSPDQRKRLPHLASPTAMLFWGPPGCGKTLLAKATANACGVNFIVVNGSSLHAKYVGESEANVRRVFNDARMNAPCLIFCDECEVLFPKRSDEGNHEVTRKVVAAFLSELAGIESRRDVHLIAATNFPDQIDEALLRPGRIEHKVYVPPPSVEARYSILKALMASDYSVSDGHLHEVANITNRFSGADLKFLLEAAAEVAFDTLDSLPTTKPYPLQLEHFQSALLGIEPSLSETQLAFYEMHRERHDPVYKRTQKLQDRSQ